MEEDIINKYITYGSGVAFPIDSYTPTSSGMFNWSMLQGYIDQFGKTDSADASDGTSDDKSSKEKWGDISKAFGEARKSLWKFVKQPEVVSLGTRTISNWATSGLEQSRYMKGLNHANTFIQGISPKLGMFTGIATAGLNLVDRLGSSSLKDFNVDTSIIDNIGSGYTGTSNDLIRYSDLTKQNFGLLNRGAYNKARRLGKEVLPQYAKMQEISNTSQDQKSMIGQDLNYYNYQTNINGTLDPRYFQIAKNGAKIKDCITLVKERRRNKQVINVDSWKPVIVDVPQHKEGGIIEAEDTWQPIIIDSLQEGGQIVNSQNKSRSLSELIEYAKKVNPRFIQRLSEPIKYVEWVDDKGEKQFGTHQLGYAEAGDKWIIFPYIQENGNELVRYTDFKQAIGNAIQNKNILQVDSEDEAKLFTESKELEDGEFSGYKSGWPEFFKQKPKFQNGGKTEELLNLAKEYYKDYDLSNINLIEDKSPRTEGNNLYVSNDEDTIHELWHYLSKNKPNEVYKEFYDNLDDERIKSLGGDLDFVKRSGDPNIFYQPSELEARIKAAKYKSKGVNYTKDFFKELRNDENKYGYNMRDLLHMYNDENLEKIFSLKDGGTLSVQKNVIPEGALHAHKHHMDNAEDLTKKGIPVIDNDNNQQAEIERNEIIFSLEVTKKLEELKDKYFSEDTKQKDKDQAAIEAGQLLVQEILFNTEDRTNLINSIEV